MLTHDDLNPSAAAPARARASEEPANSPDAGPGWQDRPPETPRDAPPDNGAPVFPSSAPSEQMRARGGKFYPSLPEDLRVVWGGRDLFLFVIFGLLGMLVAGGIVGSIAVKVFHVPVSELKSDASSTARSLVLILSQALWSGYVLLYFFGMVRAKSSAPFWQTIGWRKLRSLNNSRGSPVGQYLGIGAVLAILASIVGRFMGPQGNLPIEQLFHNRTTIVLLTAFGVLVAPVVEETMFRGFLYPVVARRFGIGAGVVVTGVLFGAMHMEQLWGGWGQVAVLILVGIFLTWIRARSGTVAASYLVHLGYNSLLFAGFFLATSGLQNIPGTR